ncbi:MAG: ABC-F family ATP-binding cassette domain-containing protein [Microthrixaceae bacterium]
MAGAEDCVGAGRLGMILLDAQGLSAARPGRTLFEDLDITVTDGDRIALVGINGTGKSTLLGALAGTVEAESGTVRRGSGVEVAVLEQSGTLAGDTLREALHSGGGSADAAGGRWEVEAIADRLGLGSDLDTPVSSLSGGQVKRAQLARTLVSDARVLVLDEPTNHLDLDAIDWLEEHLASRAGALLLVTHDRHFLDRVCTRIVELDRGRSFVHEGGYTSYLESRARRAVEAEATAARRANLARRELAWLRRGAPARTSKPKARIDAAHAIIEPTVGTEVRSGDLPLYSDVPRLGDRVIEAHGLTHRFGELTLFEDVELALDRRERLGIVGPNGSGKSTLLDILAGRIDPTAGSVERGPTVRIGVYDQLGRALPDDQRVRDVVAGDGEPDWRTDALLGEFWFDADAQRAPVGTLSGGERRRLQLLCTLAENPNVLLMDEPTNDLDTETLRQLEDHLEGFPGAVVVVSHDRAFLERVVADVVVLGDGAARRLPGGYAAYEAERRGGRAAGRAHARREVRGAAVPAGVSGASGAGRSGAGRSGTREPAAQAAAAPGGQPSPSTLRHRLREAQRALDAARTECEELRATLTQTAAHDVLADTGRRLADAESRLAVAEEAWLELADQIEARGLQLD